MPDLLATPERSRLRITHFIVWGAACAVVIAARMAWTDWESFHPDTHNYVRLGHIAMSLTYGAGIASLLVVWHRWRTNKKAAIPVERTFPTQPGHWLLLFMATAALADGLITLLVRVHTIFKEHDSRVPDFNSWDYNHIARFTVGTIVCLIFARWISKSWKWRSLLLVPGVATAMLAAIHILYRAGISKTWWWQFRIYTPLFASLALVPLAIGVAIVDRRHNRDRDWLHWCGVVVFVAMLAMNAIDEAYWRYSEMRDQLLEAIIWIRMNQPSPGWDLGPY